jgi:hypothetical protein
MATLLQFISERPAAFLLGGLALVFLLVWLRNLRRRLARE